MPFGTEVLESGRIRFRLWAPAARRVDLCLDREGGRAMLSVPPEADGWFAVVTDPPGGTIDYRYLIDGELEVPDPASRFQPRDVAGPSRVIDPRRWAWEDGDWRGRPWEETVIYELHVGTFSPEGTFDGLRRRLDYLADLGVTAVELMPVADFPGQRNWGYDGVLPFAPDSRYGRPDDLKNLVQSAHQRKMMVFLDVVYNHFGPEGNYLHTYAPEFFTDRHHTPWGAAINFDGPGSRVVRDFFIHNALYWLEEYRFDGLRLDAVHAIIDESDPDILTELSATIRLGPGRERRIHLILENDNNAARYLERGPSGDPVQFDAQWNDDMHHAGHVLLTRERDGYYEDYASRPVWYLGRCLAAGFGYQGEPSAFRDGRKRGEASGHLPPTAFVNFLQTHDQVGNRALGERIGALARPEAVRAAAAIYVLAPSIPLLFMGEEFDAVEPFLFFCDFGPELARAVSAGRRQEFARFERFSTPQARRQIPDPNAPATFARCRLDWDQLEQPRHLERVELYRELLSLRRLHVTPRLGGCPGGQARFEALSATAFRVGWVLGDGARLRLLANLGPHPVPVEPQAEGVPVYATPSEAVDFIAGGRIPPWSVVWDLQAASRDREREPA